VGSRTVISLSLVLLRGCRRGFVTRALAVPFLRPGGRGWDGRRRGRADRRLWARLWGYGVACTTGATQPVGPRTAGCWKGRRGIPSGVGRVGGHAGGRLRGIGRVLRLSCQERFIGHRGSPVP